MFPILPCFGARSLLCHTTITLSGCVNVRTTPLPPCPPALHPAHPLPASQPIPPSGPTRPDPASHPHSPPGQPPNTPPDQPPPPLTRPSGPPSHQALAQNAGREPLFSPCPSAAPVPMCRAVRRLEPAHVCGRRYCGVGPAWRRRGGGVEAAWRRRGGGAAAECSDVEAALR